jgi:cytochrome c oxidase subunit II
MIRPPPFRTLRHVIAPLAGAAVLAGCAGIQSALDPRGNHAELIAVLSWVMFGGAALISLGVLAATVYAMAGPPEQRARYLDRKLIIGAGIVFPVATLTALLVWSLFIARQMVAATADEAPLRIEVIGEQWWWRVHYLDSDGQRVLTSANEVRLPVGRAVEFVVSTADVIHSFWVPSLAGKIDMIPGHVNRLRVRADVPGVMRGSTCSGSSGIRRCTSSSCRRRASSR